MRRETMHILFAREPERGDPVGPTQKKGSLDGLPTLADLLIGIGTILAGQGRAKDSADAAQATACGCPEARLYSLDRCRLDRLSGRLTDAAGALAPPSARETALL